MNLQQSDQVFTFTTDYSQSMPAPSFNSAQPGETYYYSEAVGNVFRVVDLSGKDGNEHLLTAYFYMEGNAKKVATMLHLCSLIICIKKVSQIPTIP